MPTYRGEFLGTPPDKKHLSSRLVARKMLSMISGVVSTGSEPEIFSQVVNGRSEVMVNYGDDTPPTQNQQPKSQESSL